MKPAAAIRSRACLTLEETLWHAAMGGVGRGGPLLRARLLARSLSGPVVAGLGRPPRCRWPSGDGTKQGGFATPPRATSRGVAFAARRGEAYEEPLNHVKIVVTVKLVPDTNADKRIDPATKRLVRTGVETVLNPFDEYAIEAALQLKEKLGGDTTVTIFTMAPGDAATRSCARRSRWAPTTRSCSPMRGSRAPTSGAPPTRWRRRSRRPASISSSAARSRPTRSRAKCPARSPNTSASPG